MNDIERIAKLENLVRDLQTREAARWVYLTAPLTSASWDGDAIATGTTSIDTSAVFGVPANVKAVLVRVSSKWAAASNTSYMSLRPHGGADDALVLRAAVANISSDGCGVIPCDASGDIDVVVGGANTTGSVIQIYGYYL